MRGGGGEAKKKGGSGKMFSVKSGNSLSLIMGFSNKTCFGHLDIVDTGGTITLKKLERQIKVILLSHSQGIFKNMYLKPP